MTNQTEKNWRDGLPKWRVEAIDKELRHGALSWPTEARPTPAPFSFGFDSRDVYGIPTPGTYWIYHKSYRSVEKMVITKREGPDDGFAHRTGLKYNQTNNAPSGRLYMSQRDARLALIWALCDEYADILAHVKSFLAHDGVN